MENKHAISTFFFLNWNDSMREKATNEVVNTTPDGDEELDDNDGEENYDIELPKSSFNNARMALDATEQMRLFAEKQELPEFGDLLLKMTTYLGGFAIEKSQTVLHEAFFLMQDNKVV